MENKTASIWKWSVLLLALLNVALLATIWLKPSIGHNNGGPDGQRPNVFLTEQLKLTPAQVKTFDELRAVHHDSIMLLDEQSKKLRDDFFGNLKNPNADTKTVDSLAKAISENQAQKEITTYYHFKKVRELCDEKQKVTFDRIIGDVLKRMAAQRPPRDGGPPAERH